MSNIVMLGLVNTVNLHRLTDSLIMFSCRSFAVNSWRILSFKTHAFLQAALKGQKTSDFWIWNRDGLSCWVTHKASEYQIIFLHIRTGLWTMSVLHWQWRHRGSSFNRAGKKTNGQNQEMGLFYCSFNRSQLPFIYVLALFSMKRNKNRHKPDYIVDLRVHTDILVLKDDFRRSISYWFKIVISWLLIDNFGVEICPETY